MDYYVVDLASREKGGLSDCKKYGSSNPIESDHRDVKRIDICHPSLVTHQTESVLKVCRISDVRDRV